MDLYFGADCRRCDPSARHLCGRAARPRGRTGSLDGSRSPV